MTYIKVAVDGVIKESIIEHKKIVIYSNMKLKE